MYKFRQDVNVDFRDRQKASEDIGIARNTLGLIIRGQLACSKMTAYCITKLLYKEAEIEDFFERVEKEERTDEESKEI